MNAKSILKSQFGVSEQDIEKATNYQIKHNGRLEHILVNMGSLSDEEVPLFLSKLLDLPLLELESWLDKKLPSIGVDEFQFLQSQDWLPLEIRENHWIFAALYPLNLAMNEWVQQNNLEVSVYIANESQLQSLIPSYGHSQIDTDDTQYSDAEEEKLKELASEAPVVNLLNSLMAKALRQGASDMHLEPYQGRYRVRYRIDGVLHEVERLAPKMQMPLVTRLKILSGMDIAEKRRPQDGKIETKIANQEIDIRVSALPLNDGESIVMRFLRKDNVQYDMSILGLSTDIEGMIKKDIKSTAGVVLLTGPTGSGKTTTLYTFLNALNNEDVKIITLEDPVEYQLPGINQVQVNSEIGFDFAAGLRSIVRQDPDVIMLGEIRDKETAQIALQSALTGHLVFSTVHTNDAASAYTRLLDLGVEEFLLNAALVSVVAQRLARKICSMCSIPHPDKQALIEEYGLQEFIQKYGLSHVDLRKGKGCDVCSNTGYKGRMAVTEYLNCDNTIKSLPKNADFISQAKHHNETLNRRTLLEDGLYKAAQGLTTIDEVLRVAG
ncbi:Type II secretion system protein E [Pseudoalteromonas sp. CIP111854]|uniref:Type II secretion system protein E n=1 Tax=Pseudoalteromonas holothuriae TaxID=2963714 RepID=A0A9W4W3K8_9GAMM|nr:GspE/PulE family protein [Pseudoalteromonas sp. CIP111854]CAH9056827.1 Type II secretion system protein E [Pseudoalteromonas sp. CIP111854]